MKQKIARSSWRILLAAGLAAIAASVGLAASGVIGSVAGSVNASVGGQALLPNTTIFSGDNLQVQDGVAVIAVGTNNRMILGRNTAASFLRDANHVTVSLGQGNLTVLHSADGTPVRVKAEQVLITPSPGQKTIGDIAVLNNSVVVTAKEGALQVEDHGATKSVLKGQTIVIEPDAAKASGGVATAAAGGGSAVGAGTAVAAPGAMSAAGAGAAAGAVGAANFTRPSSSRPMNPARLAGLAATAGAITTGSSTCAPPTPTQPPTASTVVPFAANASPSTVCPQ